MVSAVSALVAALAVIGVSAVIPIPIQVEAHDGGVYVQAHTERVFNEDGQAVGKQVTHCHVHVFTEVDGVGETMTATDDQGNSYAAEVSKQFAPGTRDVVGGRAVFTGLEPGATLTTTNTDPSVSGSCPAS